ncbi:hypothetical protein [Nocardia africana]
MTDSQTATDSPATAEIHNAALATCSTKKEQIRYACDQLRNPSTAEVIEWLARYGVSTSRPTTSTVVNEWKREKGLHDTGVLPRLSDDVLSKLDGEVAQSPAAGGAEAESMPAATEAEHADSPLFGAADADTDAEAHPSVEHTQAVTKHAPAESEQARAAAVVSATEVGTQAADSGEPGTDLLAMFAVSEQTPDTAAVSVANSEQAPFGAPAEHEQGSEQVSVTVANTDSGVAARLAEHRPNTVPTPTEQHPTPVAGTTTAPAEKETPPGAAGFYVVSLMSLLVSLDTSWLYFRDNLGIENLWIRGGMFSVLEAALIACGIGMAMGVRRGHGPGSPQISAWILCGVSAWMAISVSGALDGAARVMLGPVLGMIMFHHALGIEKKARTENSGIWARIGRELRERMLSRFGLANDERDAAQRTRDRNATRAVELSIQRPLWKRWSRAARMERALLAAGVADDPAMLARVKARRAVVHHAQALQTLDSGSPWTEQG